MAGIIDPDCDVAQICRETAMKVQQITEAGRRLCNVARAALPFHDFCQNRNTRGAAHSSRWRSSRSVRFRGCFQKFTKLAFASHQETAAV